MKDPDFMKSIGSSSKSRQTYDSEQFGNLGILNSQEHESGLMGKAFKANSWIKGKLNSGSKQEQKIWLCIKKHSKPNNQRLRIQLIKQKQWKFAGYFLKLK
ncbi:hypothetical protein PPERSA_10922 [Pseudocohnilembus persalinus]|uniref:Uncharacterized protein n=1 Tax=Pseudocohnilembus persalinus TaxID=266149 RepID=A0A0V0R9L0_PSEPJ|nr:hypothetical protein PPERSA_10922 [Pseudocohnilembus persalinus]|eukprot:KRX11155.1 hypothetical protein PPERSA_10922 [Pseudocohnilembus persalinus]